MADKSLLRKSRTRWPNVRLHTFEIEWAGRHDDGNTVIHAPSPDAAVDFFDDEFPERAVEEVRTPRTRAGVGKVLKSFADIY